MSTKTIPGPFDGMARAQPDEPVFTLRAHDPLAPILIHEWVDRKRKAIREAFANEEITKAKRDLEFIQCREAEEIAWAMAAWRQGEHAAEVEELQDLPEPEDAILSDDAELAARAQYEIIKRACQLLQNGIANIHEASEEALAPLGLPSERAVILACRDRLKAVAAHIAPKRASYYPGQQLPEPFVEVGAEQLQSKVAGWMQECFGPVISADKLERNDRFIEEALELVQASSYPKPRAIALVDYVYGRTPGEIGQEVGGVMITLAAKCLADGVDMALCGEVEFSRISQPGTIAKIRAKQARKPTGSALPIEKPEPTEWR